MKNSSVYSLLLALLLNGAESAAADTPEVPRVYSSSWVGSPLPVSSMPEHVVAPDGELTLYADYGDFTGDSLTLYLVNRTQQRIGFSSQDGDPYVKLEAMTKDGRWERAQTHRSSWCGNSYFVTPCLRPGHYFRFAGYFPPDGERRTVRYRVYREHAFILEDDDPDRFYSIRRDLEKIPLNLISNVGEGKVRLADIYKSRRDAFAVPYGSFETVRDLALGKTKGPSFGLRSVAAVAALGRFPTEESLALLRDLLTDDDRSIPFAAMRALARIGPELDPAEQLYQEYLQGDDVQLRMMATMALKERPVTPEVIRFAKQQLGHDDLTVRVAGMSVLAGQCKQDPEMKAFINSLYDDPDPKIQSVFETVLYPTCINHQERGIKVQFQRSHTRQD